MFKLFKQFKFEIILTIIVGILFYANYTPGTYLSGWDNLQTELNPFLAIKRSFFAVWQEYQSFGLTAGMAHSSDLVRSISIWFVSLILPNHLIRYFFHIMMVLIGAIGVFNLLKYVGYKNEKTPLAFLGALFYILNLGTIQIFFLPYEPFSIFFAMLPWEILIFLKFLKSPEKRNTITLIVINVLATPQAYVQTIFAVYLIVLGCFAIDDLINARLKSLPRIILAYALILLVNSFWILPQIYFLLTNGQVVFNSKINQMSSQVVYFQNLERGNLIDFLHLRGFYYYLSQKNQPIFIIWQTFLSNRYVAVVNIGLILVTILGFFKKSQNQRAFIILYVFIAIILLTNTFPFSLINNFLRSNSLFNQMFRSPFTKLITPLVLTSCYFFVAGIEIIYNFCKKILSQTNIILIFSLAILIVSLPVFFGAYFSPQMKVAIPKDYFTLFNYFKGIDKTKRIALLPDHTYWGWFNHRWGYNGSGFAWYGIEQPIVSRTFDVWSHTSENYFWESKKAIEAEDVTRFEKVLDKYQVDYLVLDRSLEPNNTINKALQYERTEEMLSNSQKIVRVKKTDNLEIYQYLGKTLSNSFVSIIDRLPNINPIEQVINDDWAYRNNGTYKSSDSESTDIYYPFNSLQSNNNKSSKKWTIEEKLTRFLIRSSSEINYADYYLINNPNDILVYDNVNTLSLSPNTNLNKANVDFTFNKYKIQIPLLKDADIKGCDNKSGLIRIDSTDTGLIIKSQKGKTGCFSLNLNTLSQKYSYLLKIKNSNIKGQRLFFYISDKTKKQTIIEDQINDDIAYYIIPPKFQYGLGYDIVFHNNSYQGIDSINQINNVEVFAFPYNLIKSISFVKKDKPLNQNSVKLYPLDLVKKSYFYYSLSIDKSINLSQYKELILWQSFSPGWIAFINYPFIGQPLKNHVLVNNWANGWTVSQSQLNQLNPPSSRLSMDYGEVSQLKSVESEKNKKFNIVIIFWPQYLEFIGFGVVTLTLIFVLIRKR